MASNASTTKTTPAPAKKEEAAMDTTSSYETEEDRRKRFVAEQQKEIKRVKNAARRKKKAALDAATEEAESETFELSESLTELLRLVGNKFGHPLRWRPGRVRQMKKFDAENYEERIEEALRGFIDKDNRLPGFVTTIGPMPPRNESEETSGKRKRDSPSGVSPAAKKPEKTLLTVE